MIEKQYVVDRLKQLRNIAITSNDFVVITEIHKLISDVRGWKEQDDEMPTM